MCFISVEQFVSQEFLPEQFGLQENTELGGNTRSS